jgi:hypothetical protein
VRDALAPTDRSHYRSLHPPLIIRPEIETMHDWAGRDGLTIVKNVTRQTLVLDDYSGTYLGAFHASVTGCTSPGDNGSGEVPIATYTVTQNGSSISIKFEVPGFGSMTITGPLTQSGQFGAVTGTYTDTTGDAGTASISALSVQTNSLAGTFTQDSATQGCHAVGYFAAMRSRP